MMALIMCSKDKTNTTLWKMRGKRDIVSVDKLKPAHQDSTLT